MARAGARAGLVVALAGLLPLIGGIVATVIGVKVARERAQARVPLENERERLIRSDAMRWSRQAVLTLAEF